ncbi:MAG TPA: glycoside hydrolase [Deferribacteraceae bacterium]|nr:glycoside hydrolase [Deferribacteraceae bacterium]
MKKLNLAFLWHMHQPFYKDGQNGTYHMPWVFLHAIKDYYEIPRYLKDYKGIRQTFNLVPSLLVQLKDYEDINVDDIFFKTMLKKPADLTHEERCGLVPQLFMANFANMIAPFRRYAELYSKNSRSGMFENTERLFSDAEILDLQVLYLLSWTGNFFRTEYPLIANLISKGAGFTQNDKVSLMETLCEAVKRIVPLYSELQNEGIIEVSVTPFYHPILPLLIDLDSAKEALPEIPMPSAFGDFGRDPQWHVEEAVRYYEKIFERKPSGMWPAEGSISGRAAELFAGNGIKWIASDEDVLAGSAGFNFSVSSERKKLYRRHYYGTQSGRIDIFFRDKLLSDLIGFTYSGQDADKAANDFVAKLKVIYESVDESTLVPVILDGENAWEYYPENGERFFRALYERIQKEKWISTVTMSEAMNLQDVPESRLGKIRAGSWIYGNFTTWLGHREKNEAWRLLNAARLAVDREEKAEIKEKAMNEIHIAEGSDWFWWFGDDHFSLQADVFDKLFRGYLINAYKILGTEIPQELYIPIKRSYKSGLIRKPKYYLTAVPDGEVTSFFEWLSAGEFDLKFDAGAMHASSNILRRLFFGYDKENLYLRIEGSFNGILDNGYEIEAEITGSSPAKYRIPLDTGTGGNGSGVLWGINRIAEIALPHKNMPDNTGRIYIVFRLIKDGEAIERAPQYNMVEVDLWDNFGDDWIV